MMAVTGSVRYKPLCQVEECPFVNGPVTSGETSECVAKERLWQRLRWELLLVHSTHSWMSRYSRAVVDGFCAK